MGEIWGEEIQMSLGTTWAQGDDASEAAFKGAVATLNKCLGLNAGDTLALFYDETTEEIAHVINAAATQLHLLTIAREVRTETQRNFRHERELNFADQNAVTQASGILTCLCDDVDCSEFRKALIDFGTGSDRRLAHMPGARLDIFAHTLDVDYDYVERRCDDLALAMTLGSTCRLQSYVLNQSNEPIESHVLSLELGGLGRRPITSTGVIQRGTWGNIPGAETFIAPIEGSANGAFALNGSFANRVLGKGEFVLLEFADGRLSDVSGSRSGVADFLRFQESLRLISPSNHDKLAELGVGVNPAISELTGRPLIDEKCIGTAHIAIGDNSRYSGQIQANTHEDFVTREPSLWIDGKPILEHGREAFASATWRDSLGNAHTSGTLSPSSKIRRTYVGTQVLCDSLRVRHKVGPDRICVYTIGDHQTTRVLSQVYSHVPQLPNSISIRELSRKTSKAVETIIGAVSIMTAHDVVRSSRDDK